MRLILTKSDINGRYILKSYCDGSVGNIETLDYKNYMFTSTEATVSWTKLPRAESYKVYAVEHEEQQKR